MNPNSLAACFPNNQLVLHPGQAGSLYPLIMGNYFEAPGAHGYRCFANGTTALVTAQDASQWRMVNIRQPNPGEVTSRFFDLPNLRASNELVLKYPRVGFFTTPAFLAQWTTNASNQARTTINQTMIVGLNTAFDGSTQATPGMNMAALDSAHSPQQSACYSCHQTMDPMRQFFLKELNYDYGLQTDPQEMAISRWFDFQQVSVGGASLHDLADQIANHPYLAEAWAQKLCAYANSAPCDPTDPVFLGVVKRFSADLSWNNLVVDLFTSPLVTFSQETVTADAIGEAPSIARSRQLCNNLSERLNVPNLCSTGAIQKYTSTLPTETYARGAAVLPLVTQSSLTYASTLENLCSALAVVAVDNGSSVYQSKALPAALSQLSNNLMGLAPGTEAPVVAILQGHYKKIIATGATPTNALRSTFILACLSPATIGVGVGL